jgi:HK97 family phage portal protein
MIETRLFNVSEIARFFNISPVLLQDLSKSSYSSIEAANLQFLTQTLLPYISILENEFNRKLIGEENIFIDLDEREFLRTDSQSTANYLSTLKNNGIMTTNECREQLGLPRIDGGDEIYIPFTDINQNKITGEDSSEEKQEENPNEEENK